MSKRRRITEKQLAIESFKKLHNFLFTDEFIKISNDAKVLYALLRDRYELSSSNDWVNGKGEVYLIYTREEMADMLQISNSTVGKALIELKKAKLIDTERQGMNKPNLIYILDVALEETAEPIAITRKCKINQSGSVKLTNPDCQNLHPIKNYTNKTKSINTYTSNLISDNEGIVENPNREYSADEQLFADYFDRYFKFPHRRILSPVDTSIIEDWSKHDKVTAYWSFFKAFGTGNMEYDREHCSINRVYGHMPRYVAGEGWKPDVDYGEYGDEELECERY